MADIIGELVVQITGETKQYEKSIDNSEKKLNKLSSRAKKFGANITKTATAAILGLGVASVKAASDLGESINAVNVVFGEGADTILGWGKTASEQAGLSQRAFNESATTIGTLLKKSGEDIGTVADKTIELTQRSADLASVFNTEVSEATTALGAALRGETEPARRFGINLSAVAVESEALALGLAKTKKEITESDKIQARYSLILKESAQVAGDFNNTNEDAANSLRIIKAEIENAGAEIGQTFLPILKDVLISVREGIETFNNLTEGQKTFAIGIAGLVASIPPAIKAVAALKVAVVALGGPVSAVVAAVVALGIGIAALNKKIRDAELEKQKDLWGDLSVEIGKTTEEIDKIGKNYAFLASQGVDQAEAFKDLNEEFKVNSNELVKILALQEDLTEEERKSFAERAKRIRAFEKERERIKKINNDAIRQIEEEKLKQQEADEATKQKYLNAQDLIKKTLVPNRELLDNLDREIASLEDIIFLDKELEAQRLDSIKKLKTAKEEAENENKVIDQKEIDRVNNKISLEEEYSSKLLEQSGNRLDILNKERDAALKIAEDTGADRSNIVEFYANEEQKIKEEQIQEQEQAEIDSINKVVGFYEQSSEDIKKIFQSTSEDALSSLGDFVQNIGALSGSVEVQAVGLGLTFINSIAQTFTDEGTETWEKVLVGALTYAGGIAVGALGAVILKGIRENNEKVEQIELDAQRQLNELMIREEELQAERTFNIEIEGIKSTLSEEELLRLQSLGIIERNEEESIEARRENAKREYIESIRDELEANEDFVDEKLEARLKGIREERDRKLEAIDEEYLAEKKLLGELTDAEKALIEFKDQLKEEENQRARDRDLERIQELLEEGKTSEAELLQQKISNEDKLRTLEEASNTAKKEREQSLEDLEIERANNKKDRLEEISKIEKDSKDAEIKAIEDSKDAEIKAIDSIFDAEKTRQTELAKIEKKRAELEREIKISELEANKLVAISQVPWYESGAFGNTDDEVERQYDDIINKYKSLPQLNTGAIVPGTSLGTPVVVGERNADELIMSTSSRGDAIMSRFAEILDSKMGNGSSQGVTIVFNNAISFGNEAEIRKAVRKLRPYMVDEDIRVGAI